MSPPIRVRFAPSPTGLLHLGNARTALLNWLFARRHAGRLILRIDDTDRARSEERFVAAIREDLRWLGLDWDEEVRQSERAPVHGAAFARLQAKGLVYPAYETPDELAAWRAGEVRAGRAPVFTAAARGTDAASGRAPHWRFALGLDSQSDPVVMREDGSATYVFASAADDADLAISHVIRGADHATNSAIHRAMIEALEAPAPVFVPLPLLADSGGHKLSKRRGSPSLRSLAEAGIEPLAVAQVLAALGTAHAPAAGDDLAALVARFDLEAYGKATPRLDMADIQRLSDAIRRRRAADDVGDLLQPLAPLIEDAAYCRTAAGLLPDPVDFDAWVEALKQATGRKGRALFHPLRLALTGRERGPELRHLLALLPRETARRRLCGETA
jgi:glutamyl-tRNA synthetase